MLGCFLFSEKRLGLEPGAGMRAPQVAPAAVPGEDVAEGNSPSTRKATNGT